MLTVKRVNWLVVGGLCFCLMAWAFGVYSLNKTTNLYVHRSNAGFRHDFIEHARGHWLTVKRVVVAPTKAEQPDRT